MIRSVEYRVLTAEEAIANYIKNNKEALGTLTSLSDEDTVTITYPVSLTVRGDVAKRIANEKLKEYINENSSYRQSSKPK
jgi:hypothetical protein